MEGVSVPHRGRGRARGFGHRLPDLVRTNVFFVIRILNCCIAAIRHNTNRALWGNLSALLHHDEFEASELSVEKIKEKIKNKEMFYDHFAQKESKNKWDFNYKLKKIDHEFLPEFLKINSEKYKEWFDWIDD